MDKEKWLKKVYANPFNWVGSKHRYLREYFNVVPWEKKGIRVLDPFVGGGDLISKLPTDWSITANDKMTQVVELHIAIQEGKINVDNVLASYIHRNMSKTNKDAFTKLRVEYNQDKDIRKLYLLMTNSFNNQLRFNQSGGFNMPFGKDRSHFSTNMQNKLGHYSDSLSARQVNFTNQDVFDFRFEDYDLIVLDPPYSNTCATYNEATGWSEKEDKLLFDKLEVSGVDFIYFNQTWSKGIVNKTLVDWLEKHNKVILKETSTGCNHQRKVGFTEEVMVYKITKEKEQND